MPVLNDFKIDTFKLMELMDKWISKCPTYYFIVVLNAGSTTYGSVDDISIVNDILHAFNDEVVSDTTSDTQIVQQQDDVKHSSASSSASDNSIINYRGAIHIDAAFGGMILPFTSDSHWFDYEHV